MQWRAQQRDVVKQPEWHMPNTTAALSDTVRTPVRHTRGARIIIIKTTTIARWLMTNQRGMKRTPHQSQCGLAVWRCRYSNRPRHERRYRESTGRSESCRLMRSEVRAGRTGESQQGWGGLLSLQLLNISSTPGARQKATYNYMSSAKFVLLFLWQGRGTANHSSFSNTHDNKKK